MNTKIEQWIRPDPTHYEETWLAPNLMYIIAGDPIKAVEEFGRRHGNIPPSRARLANRFVGKIPPSKVWSLDPRSLISGYSQYHDLTVGIIRGDSYVISPGTGFKDGGIPILGKRTLGHLRIVR